MWFIFILANHTKGQVAIFQIEKANWSSILDFHGVIYFLQKNTRLYTKAFIQLPVSLFSFHYKPSLDLARIMILTSRRGLLVWIAFTSRPSCPPFRLVARFRSRLTLYQRITCVALWVYRLKPRLTLRYLGYSRPPFRFHSPTAKLSLGARMDCDAMSIRIIFLF